MDTTPILSRGLRFISREATSALARGLRFSGDRAIARAAEKRSEIIGERRSDLRCRQCNDLERGELLVDEQQLQQQIMEGVENQG